MSGKPPIICLLGPTGTGKTAAAIAISERLPASVINFDSRQVYRDFPIITAQPDEDEKAACPHHLYGFLSTEEKMTAARLKELAEDKIREVRAQGRLPVLVGGTGLYLRSLLSGIAPIPEISAEVREQVLARVRSEGPQALHGELVNNDPEYAARIHPNDTQRNARAAEVFLATGRNMTWWHTQSEHTPAPFEPLKIGMRIPLNDLEPHLARRIGLMVEQGAVDEARAAFKRCPDPDAPGWTGIGCAELLAFLREETTLDQAREQWVRNTRAYAKRQITWFNKETDIHWFSPGENQAIADLVEAWLAERS
ncbi:MULTISPECIES: tRNA (adenosine(37)-N6)-dimethylallyltransferase MiaA [unclassified Pseudodesulfovibrio]|uniref:tRNA (adenosine(37)-N6)-dimethylallyltransferase MiaA n=1 Tax=unclassified Pseudodesulfovibrio TaxID=2661612 RepID=UPI000FEBECEF|nr:MULTISPECIES: tRNA (adenosine(37)-N6)-dimethylallyltransferase MiaA [unclassified Pseudodesulfovibrio]MCJ2163694.1 tRNA (adenosine(37)-N6)-dimethylallyltransferase MiaA [Pseudodesulfovibrio sp. S3-i]RWU06049.1 tRNA (adenosine(37)-N6)-dimethylallyltransferase MiaA [Pseudodesulfovibrio sp. S3]